jgi:hypothetical protein
LFSDGGVLPGRGCTNFFAVRSSRISFIVRATMTLWQRSKKTASGPDWIWARGVLAPPQKSFRHVQRLEQRFVSVNPCSSVSIRGWFTSDLLSFTSLLKLPRAQRRRHLEKSQ